MSDLPFEFEIVSTLDDHVALYLYVQRRPREIARVVVYLAGLLVFLMAMLALSDVTTIAGAFERGARLPMTEAVLASAGRDVASQLPILAGLFVLFFLVYVFVLAPRGVRSFARRALLACPGVDPNDPQLTERNQCKLDERGYTRSVEGSRNVMAWSMFTHLVETRDHVFLMSGHWAGVVYPKRGASAETLERARAIVATHLAEAGRSA